MEPVEAFTWGCFALGAGGLAMEVINCAEFPILQPRRLDAHESIVACVALRNERHNARGCIESLLAQPDVDRIVVCDDASDDGTPAILASLAASDARITVISNDGSPGKAGALAAAAENAVSGGARVLFFTDADMRLTPGAVASLESYRRDRAVQAASAWPRIQARSLWDQVFAQALALLLLQALPMRAARTSSDARFAAANGQLFMIDAHAYVRSGGHAACLNAVVEDVALAHALKRAGAKIALASARDIASTVGYGSLRANANGYGRSLRCGAGKRAAIAAGTWQLCAFSAPWLLLPFASRPALLACCAGVTAHIIASRRMGAGTSWIAGSLIGGAAVGIASLMAALPNRRFEWKSRSY
ncbi:MAG: glycosyltransferase [Candidatus Eremiobacteraeota bacterium]|nr:glycosyltransferase [Candidatus Eremiobacteraeota bacterium]